MAGPGLRYAQSGAAALRQKGCRRMRRNRWLLTMICTLLVVVAATGCSQDNTKPAAETSTTVEPGTGYITEPPKKAKDAASDLNDVTGKTQDAIDDAAEE